MDMSRLAASNQARGRSIRAYSLNITNIPSHLTRPSTASANFEYVQNFASISSVETKAHGFDPLTILIPVTDGILIIMAIIFLVALGIVALIVTMAIIKVYFPRGDFDSTWTNDWLWSDEK